MLLPTALPFARGVGASTLASERIDSATPPSQNPTMSGWRASITAAISGGVLSVVVLAGQTTTARPAPVDFTTQIRPLLSDRCFRCHGPDAGKRKRELRLDLPAGAFKTLDDGWAVVKPGQPEHSELVRRIFADDDDLMPPSESHLSLTGRREGAASALGPGRRGLPASLGVSAGAVPAAAAAPGGWRRARTRSTASSRRDSPTRGFAPLPRRRARRSSAARR